jgi:hypothetical protein
MSTLFIGDDGFHNILLLFCGENKKITFLLASLKQLINSKNPSSNPPHKTCSGFQFHVAACDSKICSESCL